ncbi:MAG: Ig-like domain-containing protein [Planctomycetaceae bacterium]
MSDFRTEPLEARCLLSAGELDPTFGTNGLVVTNVADTIAEFSIADFTTLPDGSIVAAGTVRSNTRDTLFEVTDDTNNTDVIVVRLLPNASDGNGNALDTAFGNEGVVRLTVGAAGEDAGAVQVLSDGRILVAGASHPGRLPENSEPTAVRVWQLNPDGTQDMSFGGGTGVASFVGEIGAVTDLVVQTSGRIIVTGSTGAVGEDIHLVAFHPDGTLDSTFADGGHVVTDILDSQGNSTRNVPTRALLQADQSLIVVSTADYTGHGTAVVRYSPDGVQDLTFGTGGRFFNQLFQMYDIVPLPDGYLLGGEALIRLRSDGRLDPSFNGDGIALPGSPFPYGGFGIQRLRVLGDGTIQAAGNGRDGYGDSWIPPSGYTGLVERAFAQFTSDGVPDPAFDGDGFLLAEDVTPGHFGFSGFIRGDIWQADGGILIPQTAGDAGFNRLTADFVPDPGFGIGTGFYTGETSFSNSIRLPSSDEAHDVVMMPDGKIVVSGRSRGTYELGQGRWKDELEPGGALLLRYDSSGKLDTSFDGYGDTDSPWDTEAGDGRIVLAQSSSTASSGENGLISDLLLQADGSLFAPTLWDDRQVVSGEIVNSLGEIDDGWWYASTSVRPASIDGVVRMQDGRIAIATRLTGYTNPRPPASGVVIILKPADSGSNVPYVEEVRWTTGDFLPVAMGAADDGTLLIASSQSVIRFSATGEQLLELPPPFVGPAFEIRDLIVQPDGRTVVTGTVDLPSGRQAFATRYLPDGSPDSAFGALGTAVVATDEVVEVNSVVATTAGEVVIVGSLGNSLAVLQLNDDGSTAADFGVQGIVRIVAAENAVRHVGSAVAVQPDGCIVVVGWVTNGDGREDVVVARLLDSARVPTPSVTHITPDNGRHDRDAVTSSGNLVIHGRGLPGSTVTVFRDDVQIGNAVCDDAGDWAYDATAVNLGEGTYVFRAVASSQGHQSDSSTTLTVIVDQTPPAPSVPELTMHSLGTAGGTVGDYVVWYRGIAESESTVRLFVDGQPLMEDIRKDRPMDGVVYKTDVGPDGNGPWSTQDAWVRYFTPGLHFVSTQVEDVAGNLSPISDEVTMWIVDPDNTSNGRPTITVTGGGSVAENSQPSVVFDGPPTGLDLPILLTWTGTATDGVDYVSTDVAFSGTTSTLTDFLVDDTVYEPDETIVVTGRSAATLSPASFTITILEDDAPTLSSIPNLLAAAGTPLPEVSFEVGNYAAGVDVPISVSSDNQTLVADADIAIIGTGSERHLVVNAAPGRTGTATISITAGHGAALVTQTFTVTVADADDVTTFLSLPDQVTRENQSLSIPVTMTGPDPDAVSVTVVSSNQVLLPDINAVLTGTGTDRLLTLTPLPQKYGETMISLLTVNAGNQLTEVSFRLTVLEVDDPPVIVATTAVISSPEDQVFDSALLTEPLFQVSDVDSSVLTAVVTVLNGYQPSSAGGGWSRGSIPGGQRLTLTAAASTINNSLASLRLQPSPDWDGDMPVTLEVNDGGTPAFGYATSVISASTSVASSAYVLGRPATPSLSSSWQISSSAVSGPQTIAVGFDHAMFATGTVISEAGQTGFVSRVEVMDESGIFSEVWAGTDSLPAPGDLVLNWPQTDFEVFGLRITVDTDSGTADFGIDGIRLLGSHPDGPSLVTSSLTIDVTPVNDLPQLPNPGYFPFHTENQHPYSSSFLISDVETPLADLQIDFKSGNESLLSSAAIVYDRASQILQLPVDAGVFGVTTLTVTVTDEDGGVTIQVYDVTVGNSADGPMIVGPSQLFTIDENTDLEFTVQLSDPNTPNLSELQVVGVAFVGSGGDTSVQVSQTGAVRPVRYTPPPDFNGQLSISITATNASGGRGSYRLLGTVLPRNSAPYIVSSVAAQVGSSGSLSLSQLIGDVPSLKDVDSGNVQVNLAPGLGMLQLTDDSQVYVLQDGISTGGVLSFWGTLASVNQALKTAVYSPQPGTSGDVSIAVTARDCLVQGSTAGSWVSTAFLLDSAGATTPFPSLQGAPDGFHTSVSGSSYRTVLLNYATPMESEGLTLISPDASLIRNAITRIELVDTLDQVHDVRSVNLINEPSSATSLTITWPHTTWQTKQVRLQRYTYNSLDLDAVHLDSTVQPVTTSSLSATAAWTVKVTAPPQLAVINDVALPEDSPGISIPLVMSDSDNIIPDVSAIAADPDLFAEIRIDGSGFSRQLALVPAENLSGSTTVTVTVTTSNGTASRTFAVVINPVNDAPDGAMLVSNLLAESLDNSAAEREFGQLVGIDIDSTVHTFQLVPGIGDADNDFFTIAGDRISVQPGVVLDYEQSPEFHVRLRVSDQFSSHEIPFVIPVVNEVDEFQLALSKPELFENQAPLVGTVVRNTGVSGSQTVTLWTSRPDLVQLPQTVTIPAGQWQTTFTVTPTGALPEGESVMSLITVTAAETASPWLSLKVTDTGFSGPPAADLIAVSFDVLNDHILHGLADLRFEIRNTGNLAAGPSSAMVIWSPNGVIGDADDVLLPDGIVSVGSLAAGESEVLNKQLQLDPAMLVNRSNAADPAGQPLGAVSQEFSLFYLVVDVFNNVSERVEGNNHGQGHLIDSDDVTFFPWDTNGDGVVAPLDALGAIQSIGTANATYDFDGNGVVTPLEALSAIQRIGYRAQ